MSSLGRVPSRASRGSQFCPAQFVQRDSRRTTHTARTREPRERFGEGECDGFFLAGNSQQIIWAQGARAGDPLFFSSLYTKTCTRTRSAETADATYGRLPRSRAGRRRAQAAGRHRASVRGNLCGLRTRTRRGGDDGRARGAWRLDGGARRVETIAPSSPSPVLLGRRPTSPCNPSRRFLLLPCPSRALETPATSPHASRSGFDKAATTPRVTV